MWSCERDAINDISSCLELLVTLERARGGSVFFDGISRMSRALQSELLTFLTDMWRKTSCGGNGHASRSARIIAGNPASLLSDVEDGTFDQKLFYRLNMVHIVADDDC